MSRRVLIIDDEESICWGLSQLCAQLSFECETASSAEVGLELAARSAFDLIIMDVRLPGLDGISAIKKFHHLVGNVPVITITAFGDLQTAIGAVKNGAYEYIVKPFELEAVRQKILQAIATKNLLDGNNNGDQQSPRSGEQNSLIGSSELMQEVFKQIALTTTSNAPVLVTGESGTGKELTARSIHQFGLNAGGPFVAVNIAALSPTIIESELFGHVKGAFTGADNDKAGWIQQSDGGTLFLDEVAEIPLEIQVKLLRVLDLGEVTPVGSHESIKTNFRLISATHQDLLSQINHGEFRHDLFYRLRTFEIQLPPLRQRREDIPELVLHFLRDLEPDSTVTTTDEFLRELKSRRWSGNIRELHSVVQRAAAMARGGVLLPEHIAIEVEAEPIDGIENGPIADQLRELVSRWTVQNWDDPDIGPLYEKLIRLIDPAVFSAAYQLSDEQYSTAARRLGIHRTTLKKKLDEAASEA